MTTSSAVKVESSENGLCHGCLSYDRALEPLKHNGELFRYLLGQQHSIKQPKCYSILLCWECSNSLHKVVKFQQRIQSAQLALQTLHRLDHSITSLSTLTVVTPEPTSQISIKHEDNVDINEDIKNTEENYDLPPKLKHKTDTIEIKKVECKQETPDESDNVEQHNYIDYDVTEDIKEEFVEEVLHTKRDIVKKQKKKNEGKAVVIKNNEVDFSNPEKYFTKIFLSHKEMEEIGKRRQECSVKKDKMRNYCKKCKIGYFYSVDLKRHNTLKHTKQSTGSYKCLQCNASTPTWKTLQSHWDIHNHVLKCSLCEGTLRHKYEMTKHLQTHEKLYRCVVCQLQFNTSREFGKHYKELHKQMICDYCGRHFTCRTAILKHFRRNHLTPKCYKCGKLFANYTQVRRHGRAVHAARPRTRRDTESAYCVECDKQFPSETKYKKHILASARHTPQAKVRVPCPVCGKSFARKIYMKNHHKLYHEQKSKHYCDLCDKYFVNAFSVAKHRRYVHDKIPMPKTKMCDICGRAFSTNRILTNHRRTHTGERPFQCAHCPAAFAQQVALAAHTRTQHALNNAPGINCKY